MLIIQTTFLQLGSGNLEKYYLTKGKFLSLQVVQTTFTLFCMNSIHYRFTAINCSRKQDLSSNDCRVITKYMLLHDCRQVWLYRIKYLIINILWIYSICLFFTVKKDKLLLNYQPPSKSWRFHFGRSLTKKSNELWCPFSSLLQRVTFLRAVSDFCKSVGLHQALPRWQHLKACGVCCQLPRWYRHKAAGVCNPTDSHCSNPSRQDCAVCWWFYQSLVIVYVVCPG